MAAFTITTTISFSVTDLVSGEGQIINRSLSVQVPVAQYDGFTLPGVNNNPDKVVPFGTTPQNAQFIMFRNQSVSDILYALFNFNSSLVGATVQPSGLFIFAAPCASEADISAVSQSDVWVAGSLNSLFNIEYLFGGQ